MTVQAERYKELAQRAGAGVEITLYWSTADDRLLVVVDDEVTGDLFEFEVEPGSALDALEHPFAYAARNGIDYLERPVAA